MDFTTKRAKVLAVGAVAGVILGVLYRVFAPGRLDELTLGSGN